MEAANRGGGLDKKRAARLFLQSLVYAGCTFGFFVLVQGQMTRFIAGKSSVAITYNPAKDQPLPNVVFCLEDPFPPDATWTDIVDSTGMVPRVKSGGVNLVEFQDNEPVPVNWTDLDTAYNGRCRMMTTEHRMIPGSFFQFLVDHGQGPMSIYFLRPGEEIFMIFQNWGFSSMRTLTFDRPVLVGLYTMKYSYLQNPKGLDCMGRDEKGLTDCVKQKVSARLRAESNITCVPIHLKFIDPDFEICGNDVDGETKTYALKVASRAMADVDHGRLCKMPCDLITYHVTKSSVTYVKDSPSGSNMDHVVIYVHFPSTVETVHEEYYIYDPVGIVSSVGGALGLFLGFSCLSLTLGLLGFCWKEK